MTTFSDCTLRASATWLGARPLGCRGEAAELQLAVFQAHPSAWSCKQVLEAAPDHQRTDFARQMLTSIPAGADVDLRLELCLALGNARSAADLVRSPRASLAQRARVAAALAPVDLDEAENLWRRAVEPRITDQNRGAHAEAARWLRDMRAALHGAQRFEQWQEYIQRLWIQYPRHQALHDELERAGVR